MLGTFHYGKEVLITAAIVIKYNVYNMHYFDNNYLSQSQGAHYTYELNFPFKLRHIVDLHIIQECVTHEILWHSVRPILYPNGCELY